MSNKTVLDATLSKKLSRVSFICALLVVLQHSRTSDVAYQAIICGCLTRVAVPFFFVISGFLFYKSFDMTFLWAKGQIRNRLRTLMVPYLFWSLFGAVLKSIISPEWFNVANVEWWVQVIGPQGIPAAAGHLWFVGELMKFTLLGLPIGFLLKYCGLTLPLGCAVAYALGFKAGHMSNVLWFSLGGWIVMHQETIKNVITNRSQVVIQCLCVSGGALTVILYIATHNFTMETMHGVFEMCYSILAMIAIWIGVDMISSWAGWRFLDKFTSTAFFLYCSHVFLLRVPISNIFYRMIFLTVSSLAIYWGLRRLVPHFLATISGGRAR